MRALLLLCTLLAAAQALRSVPPQQPGGQPASEARLRAPRACASASTAPLTPLPRRAQVPGQSVQWRKSVAGADCQRVCAARTRAWPTELRTPVGGVPDGYLCASRGIYGAGRRGTAHAQASQALRAVELLPLRRDASFASRPCITHCAGERSQYRQWQLPTLRRCCPLRAARLAVQVPQQQTAPTRPACCPTAMTRPRASLCARASTALAAASAASSAAGAARAAATRRAAWTSTQMASASLAQCWEACACIEAAGRR
jgi:hypothetical protein